MDSKVQEVLDSDIASQLPLYPASFNYDSRFFSQQSFPDDYSTKPALHSSSHSSSDHLRHYHPPPATSPPVAPSSLDALPGQLSSLQLQLSRSRNSHQHVLDENAALQSRLSSVVTSSLAAQQTYERTLSSQGQTITAQSDRVTSLELALREAFMEREAAYKKYEEKIRDLEEAVKQVRAKGTHAITQAEEAIDIFNADWMEKLSLEKRGWDEVLRRTAAETEDKLKALKAEVGEAHQHCKEQVAKAKAEAKAAQVERDENAKQAAEEKAALARELEYVKGEKERERQARKTLTKQLKKERLWRERAQALSQDARKLLLDPNGDSDDAAAEQDSSRALSAAAVDLAASTAGGGARGTLHVNDLVAGRTTTASASYRHSQHYPLGAGSGLSPQRSQQQQPRAVPGNSSVYERAEAQLADEKRKNRLLQVELLRQREILLRSSHAGSGAAYRGSPIPASNDIDLYNMTTLPGRSSNYLHELEQRASYLSNVDKEVMSLRVAVERAELETSLEMELLSGKDAEIRALHDKLESERLEKESLTTRFGAALDEYEKKEREKEREKEVVEAKRREAINEILKSSEDMHLELEEERARSAKMEAEMRAQHAREVEDLKRKNIEIVQRSSEAAEEMITEVLSEKEREVAERERLIVEREKEMLLQKQKLEAEAQEAREALLGAHQALQQAKKKDNPFDSMGIPDVGGPMEWKLKFGSAGGTF